MLTEFCFQFPSFRRIENLFYIPTKIRSLHTISFHCFLMAHTILDSSLIVIRTPPCSLSLTHKLLRDSIFTLEDFQAIMQRPHLICREAFHKSSSFSRQGVPSVHKIHRIFSRPSQKGSHFIQSILTNTLLNSTTNSWSHSLSDGIRNDLLNYLSASEIKVRHLFSKSYFKLIYKSRIFLNLLTNSSIDSIKNSSIIRAYSNCCFLKDFKWKLIIILKSS